MVLGSGEFVELLRVAPLVAIDLLVRDAQGKVLLGRRRNRPAQGYWFVPGGRIRKGERLDDAFERITAAELGFAVARTRASVQGVVEHHYDDNVAGAPGVSTHYVVIPHEFVLPSREPRIAGDDQHAEMRWFGVEELLGDPTVHRYSQAYFESLASRATAQATHAAVSCA